MVRVLPRALWVLQVGLIASLAVASALVAPAQAQNRALEGARGERFDLNIRGEEITTVLEMLSETTGLNVLASPNVRGTVSATLYGVDAEAALAAIVRQAGLIAEREGDFIFVSTPAERRQMQAAIEELAVRVYRPSYVRAADLQAVITPLLSQEGLIAVTPPAETGIASGSDDVGGDSLAHGDALLVRDYESIIAQVDDIVAQMDVPPEQVAIEAMILSVELSDGMEFGVNFAMLNGSRNVIAASGEGNTVLNTSGFPSVGDLVTTGATGVPIPGSGFTSGGGGFKFGFLTEDVSGFVRALETIGHTDVVASPHLVVLNKQRAELIIGRRAGYRTLTITDTASVENVEFLETGTQLRIRPYIAPDGLVRLEVHPERSDGFVNPDTGLPEENTTEVTTNILVRDGCTVVIGGLIQDEISRTRGQVPVLGGLPLVGRVFQQDEERIIRRELIVLITPRIVREPFAHLEGEQLAWEHRRRQDRYGRSLSFFGQLNQADAHYEQALAAYESGDLAEAAFQVEEALRLNPSDLRAFRLREAIYAYGFEANAGGRMFNWLRRPEPVPGPGIQPYRQDVSPYGMAEGPMIYP